MNERRPGCFKPIFRNQPNENQPRDFRQVYGEMATALRISPENLVGYMEVIKDVLADYADDKGELIILND